MWETSRLQRSNQQTTKENSVLRRQMLSQHREGQASMFGEPFPSSPSTLQQYKNNPGTMSQRQALSPLHVWNERPKGWTAGEKRPATIADGFLQAAAAAAAEGPNNENHKRHCSEMARQKLCAAIRAEANSRKRPNDNAPVVVSTAISMGPSFRGCKKTKIQAMGTSSPMAMCVEEPVKKRDAAAKVWDFIGVG